MGKALVTGGSGLIGSHLVEHLLSEGDEVRVLLRDAVRPGWLASATVGLDVVTGDITDSQALDRAVHGVDVVYHVAGRTLSFSEGGFNQVNQAGTANVAAACARRTSPPVLVAVSSLAAAGPSLPGRPRVEDDRPAPITAYGRSKLRGEEALRNYASQVPITIIRPPGVFGPREPYFLGMFKLVWRGWHVTVGSGGSRSRWLRCATWQQVFAWAPLAAADCPRRRTSCQPASTSWPSPSIPPWMDSPPSWRRALDRPPPRPIRVPVFLAWGIAAAAEAAARLRRQPGFVSFDKVREARRKLDLLPAAGRARARSQAALRPGRGTAADGSVVSGTGPAQTSGHGPWHLSDNANRQPGSRL